MPELTQEMLQESIDKAEKAAARLAEAQFVTPDELKAVKDDLVDVGEKIAKTQEDFDRQAKEIAEQRKFMEVEHGKSGRKDINEILNKWLRGIYHHKRFGKVPELYQLSEYDFESHGFATPKEMEQYKAGGGTWGMKADMTTTTDATAGYLVPTLVRREVVELRDLYGKLLPRVTRITCPAGITMTIPRDLVQNTAYWRAQGTAIGDTPATFQGGSVTPKLHGNVSNIANEMLEAPGASIVEVLTKRIMRSLIRLEETGLMQGDDDAAGDGTDPPSDGILTHTTTNDQTDIADNTHENLTLFVTESITDNNLLYDTENAVICLHPVKWRAQKADAVASSYWGVNLIAGTPETFEGYPVIVTPSMLITATYWAAMFDPSYVIYADTGQYAVDLNPVGSGWHSNETSLRVFSHADWELGSETQYSKADYS